MPHAIAVTVLSLVMFLTPVAFSLTAMGLPLMLGCLSVLVWTVPVLKGRRSDARPDWPVAAAGGALLLYLIVSALIAPEAGEALGKTAAAAAIFAGCLLGLRGVTLLDRDRQTHLATLLLAGAVVGAGVAASEIVSGLAIAEFMFERLPGFLWSARHKAVNIQGGEAEIALFAFNKNMSGLSLVVWPALLVALYWPRRNTGLAIAAALAVSAAVAIAGSDSLTAKIAAVGGLAVFILARLWPRAVHWTLATLWVAGFVVAVPLALALGSRATSQLDWLPPSAKSRLLIWDYTAQQVHKRPWLGIGIRATRRYQQEVAAEYQRRRGLHPGDLVYKRRPGWHAHNVFLQSWYELGGVGAALVAGFGLAVLAGLRRAAAPLRAWHYGLFTATVLTASFGWGMWQGWLLAGIGLAAILMSLATTVARRRAEAREGGPA